jgi:hypothetical protein
MAAANYDIKIEQGATFKLSILWKAKVSDTPIDLSGFEARMQVRRNYSSAEPWMTLTSEDGEIVLGGVEGTVEVTGSAAKTSAVPNRLGVYDIELYRPLDGFVRRLLQGEVTVSPEVTKYE